MKKKNVNNLSLNKKTITNFKTKHLKGGTMIPTASCILCALSLLGDCGDGDVEKTSEFVYLSCNPDDCWA